MSFNSLLLQQNCEYAIKNCNFAGVTGPNCASQFCYGFPATSGTCPQIGLDPMNCCGSSNPASCLNSWIHGGANSAVSSANPCASVVNLILSCSSVSPSLFPSNSIYTSGPQATSLAGCMCYDSTGSYNPNLLDDYASQCVASGSSAHPTYYPYASLMDGFCTNIAAPMSASASVTSSGSSYMSTTGGGGATVTSSSAGTVASTGTGSGATTSAASVTSSSAAGPNFRNPLHIGCIILVGLSMLTTSILA